MANSSKTIKPNFSHNRNHPPFLSIKQEPASAPPTPQPPPQFLNVKGEPQETPAVTPRPPPSQPIAQPPPPPPSTDRIMKSVDELRGLSAAINSFTCRFDELQKHLNFIEKSIDARYKDLTGGASSSLPPLQLQTTLGPEVAAIGSAIVPVTAPTSELQSFSGEKENPPPVNPESASETQKNIDSEQKQPGRIGNEDATKEQQNRSELEYLCQMMCSRGLRKHLISRLSDIAKLREEAPAALKRAPNPAKLVFECIGRFFLQGRKAFCKDSPMIPARQASVLILEFFLLMMGDCSEGEVEIEPSVKQEAEAAAIAWRKRLITEGGIRKACDIDARGLLLFVGCFGVPAAFKNEDVRYLIWVSNPSEVSEALRRSRVLVAMIPDIMEGMLKNRMSVEAVNVAYTFGVEDKYPPQPILISFLREAKEALKRVRRDASFMALKEANEKHLADLKSVIKCLEDHKVDPAKLLSGWQIKERIISLEKEIADLNKKIEDKVQKRKMDEIESSNRLKSRELKRSRFTAKGSPLISPSIIGLHEQRAAMYADGMSSYDGMMSTSYLDGGLSSHVSGFPAASLAQQGSSVPGVGTGMATGIGSQSAGLYAGVHGEVLVDNAGKMMNDNGHPYGWRGVGNAAFGERSNGQSFAGQRASVGMDGLLRQSPSIEGFPGLPNHSSIDAANRSAGSDLYRFADAVLESELYRKSSSQIAGSSHPVVPAHHSSYLY